MQALGKAATSGAAAAISGVRGMGGVGKTELAYAAARRLAKQFPDAQLLVELRGASSNPATPAQALQTVIRAFEREVKLPDDLGQLRAVYCDKLAGKQALILADDARDAAQVRPLLPPPGCGLLVTSRNRFSLPGIAAINLEVLPAAEAERLLLDCPRISRDASALAQLFGYLPLALRVSASLLEANDTRSVARYLVQLRAERLTYLSDPDDPAASVEASLQLSYSALDAAARAALEQLSVFVTSFDQAAAQAVVALAGDAAAALEALRRRSLLEWDATLERYSLHDLVRAFAAARLEHADAVRLRYAGFYARLARSLAEQYLRGGEYLAAALTTFDRERTHLDAGWRWVNTQAPSSEGDKLLRDYGYLTAGIGALQYHPRKERIPCLRRRSGPRAGQRIAAPKARGWATWGWPTPTSARCAVPSPSMSSSS